MIINTFAYSGKVLNKCCFLIQKPQVNRLSGQNNLNYNYYEDSDFCARSFADRLPG